MKNIDKIKQRINKMTSEEYAVFMVLSTFHILYGYNAKEMEIAVESLKKDGYIDFFVERLESEVDE